MKKYQSIRQFLDRPFNKESYHKNLEYDKKYREFKNGNKIRLEGYCKIEDSYYLHLTVPSESRKDEKFKYDVVLRFFTNGDDKLIKEPSLINYKIQFFSNSPGFMYKYAVLYKMHGYLITELYKKMDPAFINKLPDKTNANYQMSYDKSIYFACKFLTDKQFRYLSKVGVLLQMKKTPEKFFNEISSFKDIKVSAEMRRVEKLKLKELSKPENRMNPDRMIRDVKGSNNPKGVIKAKVGAKMTTGSKVIKPKSAVKPKVASKRRPKIKPSRHVK